MQLLELDTYHLKTVTDFTFYAENKTVRTTTSNK